MSYPERADTYNPLVYSTLNFPMPPAERSSRSTSTSLFRSAVVSACTLGSAACMSVAGDPLSFLHISFGARVFWRSNIRETMLKIMIYPDHRRSKNVRHDTFNDDEDEKLDDCEQTHDWESTRGDSHHPMGPSSCIFWCSIALGALARARPVALVSCRALIARTCACSPPSFAVLLRKLRYSLCHPFECEGVRIRVTQTLSTCSLRRSCRWMATPAGRRTRWPRAQRPPLRRWQGVSDILRHAA